MEEKTKRSVFARVKESLAKLFDSIDKKMEEEAKSKPCCCKPSEGKDKKCCS